MKALTETTHTHAVPKYIIVQLLCNHLSISLFTVYLYTPIAYKYRSCISYITMRYTTTHKLTVNLI